MSPLLWSLATGAIVVMALILLSSASRTQKTRRVVLEEVRRRLRGGAIERIPARGPQARGRLGELEITVDLHHDAERKGESPMWRVMAVGPVRITDPVELHVGSWRGWIDPWMQMEKSHPIAGGPGPTFTVHTHCAVTMDHPVVVALRRRGPSLGPGALHVQRDYMRAEIRFDPEPENNRLLFAYLDAMSEISSRDHSRAFESPRPLRAEFSRGGS